MAAAVVLGEQQLLQQLKKEGLMLMLQAQQVSCRVLHKGGLWVKAWMAAAVVLGEQQRLQQLKKEDLAHAASATGESKTLFMYTSASAG
jgi:hypothetical protein